ncbi:MAG: hypothetical protein J5785_04460 [Spirochaetales bacterium]|nr:hypothetical protein [Spirochaetales bacterium]
MKKLSKACFIIGIVVMVCAVVLIVLSFCSATVVHTETRGHMTVRYTTVRQLGDTRTLICGCSGILAGLLLFILSAEVSQLPPYKAKKCCCKHHLGQAPTDPAPQPPEPAPEETPAATEEPAPEAAPAEEAPAPEAPASEPAPEQEPGT